MSSNALATHLIQMDEVYETLLSIGSMRKAKQHPTATKNSQISVDNVIIIGLVLMVSALNIYGVSVLLAASLENPNVVHSSRSDSSAP